MLQFLYEENALPRLQGGYCLWLAMNCCRESLQESQTDARRTPCSTEPCFQAFSLFGKSKPDGVETCCGVAPKAPLQPLGLQNQPKDRFFAPRTSTPAESHARPGLVEESRLAALVARLRGLSTQLRRSRQKGCVSQGFRCSWALGGWISSQSGLEGPDA